MQAAIDYFARVSHSLSHSEVWPDVIDVLKTSFVSGENPGYNPN